MLGIDFAARSSKSSQEFEIFSTGIPQKRIQHLCTNTGLFQFEGNVRAMHFYNPTKTNKNLKFVMTVHLSVKLLN